MHDRPVSIVMPAVRDEGDQKHHRDVPRRSTNPLSRPQRLMQRFPAPTHERVCEGVRRSSPAGLRAAPRRTSSSTKFDC